MPYILALILLVIFVAVIILLMKFSSQMGQQINFLSQQLNERLKENSAVLQETNRAVGQRLDSASLVFGEVQKSLGRLEETHRQIYEISKDISSLQNLLRAPKFRGEVGETLLEKLLEDILPQDNFKLQHRFKSQDTVDAAVIIGNRLISIDAKFPLENFKKTQEANGEDEKKTAYRTFLRDVKNRIDEISSKYILTDEGTFDFALMYIPAEGVYYQIIKDGELNAYAKAKKVIFVSPNTFYAYLQAILYGLKGINIQKNIQKIFSELNRIQMDFKKFQDDFNTVGSHLTNAAKKYNEAREKLGFLNEKISLTTEAKRLEEK